MKATKLHSAEAADFIETKYNQTYQQQHGETLFSEDALRSIAVTLIDIDETLSEMNDRLAKLAKDGTKR